MEQYSDGIYNSILGVEMEGSHEESLIYAAKFRLKELGADINSWDEIDKEIHQLWKDNYCRKVEEQEEKRILSEHRRLCDEREKIVQELHSKYPDEKRTSEYLEMLRSRGYMMDRPVIFVKDMYGEYKNGARIVGFQALPKEELVEPKQNPESPKEDDEPIFGLEIDDPLK
jgi:hypothetical protein